MVAVTSHLPACLAVALVRTVEKLLGGAEGPLLAGPGFASATRLAKGDPAMTSQILSQNAEPLSEGIREFVRQLELIGTSLADPGELEGGLSLACASLDRLNRRAGQQ